MFEDTALDCDFLVCLCSAIKVKVRARFLMWILSANRVSGGKDQDSLSSTTHLYVFWRCDHHEYSVRGHPPLQLNMRSSSDYRN